MSCRVIVVLKNSKMIRKWWGSPRNTWGQFTITKQDLKSTQVYWRNDLNIHCLIIVIFVTIIIITINLVVIIVIIIIICITLSLLQSLLPWSSWSPKSLLLSSWLSSGLSSEISFWEWSCSRPNTWKVFMKSQN